MVVLQENLFNLVAEGRNSHTSYCGNAIAQSAKQAPHIQSPCIQLLHS
jgi:hypothetical protein